MPLFQDKIVPDISSYPRILYWISKRKLEKLKKSATGSSDEEGESSDEEEESSDWKFDFILDKMFGESWYDVYEYLNIEEKDLSEGKEYIKYEKKIFMENDYNLYNLIN